MEQAYEHQAKLELALWQKEMQRKPGIRGTISRSLQTRINRVIPEKVHEVVTAAFREMVRGVLAGSSLIAGDPLPDQDLQIRESLVRDKISVYSKTAAAEGAITGAGGILLGLADFPIWLGLKMKMMGDIALLYGHDIRDYRERLYLLYVFQLAFSGRKHRKRIYCTIENWDETVKAFPPDPEQFDWRSFQQEYRDYLDIAKLLQLIPGVGAFVGAYVNHRLTNKLGETAINAYRLRFFAKSS